MGACAMHCHEHAGSGSAFAVELGTAAAWRGKAEYAGRARQSVSEVEQGRH